MNPNAVIDTSPGRIKSLTYFGIFINFLLMISKFAGGHKIAEEVEKIVRQIYANNITEGRRKGKHRVTVLSNRLLITL